MRSRLHHVDGLRGIAAMAVVIGHWIEIAGKRSADPFIQYWVEQFSSQSFSLGRMGVVAFFCISGFVIPFSFSGARPAESFIISRFFRLYPAYWLSILLGVVVGTYVSHLSFSTTQILANTTMIQRVFGQEDILGVYWTLLIELMFYAICLIAFLTKMLHSPRFNAAIVILFVGIALAGSLYRWIHPVSNLPVGIPTYLAAMHFGTLARLHLVERQPNAAFYYPAVLGIVLIGCCTANFLAYYRAENELVGWIASITSYAIGMGLFLWCVHRKVFSGRLAVWLGVISYSIYLCHPVLLMVSETYWNATIAMIGPVPFLAAYIVATCLLAMAVQRWVERPSVRIGHRLRDWMRRRNFSVQSTATAP